MRVLIEAELDAVSGGAASATLSLASLFAAGPEEATADGEGVTVETTTVGGLASSNTAFISGTFRSRSA